MKTSVPLRAIVLLGPGFAVRLLLALDPFVATFEAPTVFVVKISWPGLGFESHAGV
jgi:hypothetical protein